jgi:hypothetical protein
MVCVSRDVSDVVVVAKVEAEVVRKGREETIEECNEVLYLRPEHPPAASDFTTCESRIDLHMLQSQSTQVKHDRDHSVCSSRENPSTKRLFFRFSCVTFTCPSFALDFTSTLPLLPVSPTAPINQHIDNHTTQHPIEIPKVAHRLYQEQDAVPSQRLRTDLSLLS